MSSKILAGRYELFEKIGEGGMSVVYKAKDKLLNRFIAVKILKPEFISDRKFIESFRRESQAAAGLSHPNIVNIYDVGQEGNIHYIVMELVEGKALSDVIREEGPLPYQRVIELSKQIAAALSQAHKHQIIHRDVKPHNVLITSSGVAKITDFGIAKAINSATLAGTTEGGIVGSVHYFSPEQARGGYVDEKSDIYSLGIVMYEMLTGRVPFDGDNPVNIALMHINSEMVQPSKLVSGIPPALEQIVMKATDKIQTNRFATADELIEALNNLEFVGSVVGSSVLMGGAGGVDVANAMDKQNRPMVETDFDDGGDEEEEEPKRKKQEKTPVKWSKKKKRMFAIILGVVILAALVAMAAALGLFGGGNVQVPSLAGQTLQQARQSVSSLGLKVEQGQLVYDANVPAGQIVSQNPPANSSVKRGEIISVDVSKGPEDGTVPDVTGLTEQEATAMLTARGFTLGQVSTAAGDLPKGQVMQQYPSGGDTVKQGTAVNLTLSDGTKVKVGVPYLIGKDIAKAKAALESAGLRLGQISYAPSDTYAVNQVIWQQYDAGKQIQKGKTVDLQVSTGGNPSNTLSYYIDYSAAQNQVFYLTVTVTDKSGTRNVINNQQRNKNAGGEYVNIQGKGTGTIIVFFDGVQVRKDSVDFSGNQKD